MRMKPILALLAIFSCFGWEYPAVAAEIAPTAAQYAPAPAAPAPVPPPSVPAQRGADELEKLAMPIALYPDPLVSIILPASVYPVEIVQAARFVRDTNNIPLVDQQPWDDTVKAVAKFPEVIAKMDADLNWTVALGQAFLEQPKELMDAIQALRAKAQNAGTLRTTPQQIVTVTNTVMEQTVGQQVVVVTNTVVEIVPSNPQVIYVPTYPPTVYYPPPTYVYDPYTPLVTFGVGMAIGYAIADNHCDWHHGGVYYGGGGFYNRNVNVDIDRNRTVNRGDRTVNRPGSPDTRPAERRWQPDQNRLRTSGAPPSAQTREARGWGGAGTQPAQRPSTGGAAARPSQGPSSGMGGARPAQQPTYNFSQRPTAGTQPARTSGAGSAQSRSFNRPSTQSSSAFGGVGSGSSARSFSNRGAASRGGGGGFGGGGGRGGGRR